MEHGAAQRCRLVAAGAVLVVEPLAPEPGMAPTFTPRAPEAFRPTRPEQRPPTLRPPSSTAPETPTSTTAGSPPLGQTRLELRLVHRHDPPPRASGRTIHLHHLRSRDGGLRISANQEVGRTKWK